MHNKYVETSTTTEIAQKACISILLNNTNDGCNQTTKQEIYAVNQSECREG